MSRPPFASPATRVRIGSTLLLAGLAAPVLADVPTPQDTPYAPGTITLQVDATGLGQRIFRVRETIPVAAGALTLLYPQWLPGNHSPSGPIDKLAGLRITAAGKPLAWQRDPLNVYAFHVDVPTDATTLDISLEYLAPTGGSGDDPNTTSQLAILEWNLITLFPKGSDAAKITVEPSLILPTGW